MSTEKLTMAQWHAELVRLAGPDDWPVDDDPEEYAEAYNDDITPAEYLEIQFGDYDSGDL